jgi:[ribosomal protein S5]-alanine N-acetyltransferase
VTANDFNDYLALLSDPAVMRFIGIEAGCIPKYEEIERIFNRALNVWNEQGYGRWSMFDGSSFEFVGFCGFRCEQEKPELILALHERFWGRGLAAEGAAACLNYGFENLGFQGAKAFTRPNHFRARRILNKLEAEFEGYVDFHGVCGISYALTNKTYPLAGAANPS